MFKSAGKQLLNAPFVLAMGGFMLIVSYLTFPRLSDEEAKWPRVQASTIASFYYWGGARHDAPDPSKSPEQSSQPTVEYAYNVDGQRYTTQFCYHLGDPASIYLRYPPGQPEKAIAEAALINVQMSYVGCAVGVVLLLYGAALVFFKFRKDKTLVAKAT